MSRLSETGSIFLATLRSRAVSHPRFSGQRLDPAGLTPQDVGQLLPVATQVMKQPDVAAAARGAASQVVSLADRIDPEFTAETARAILKLWQPATPHRLHELSHFASAVAPLKVLAGCADDLPDVADLIAPYLPRGKADGGTQPVNEPHGWMLLASLCDGPEAKALSEFIERGCVNSSLLLDELALMLSLPRGDAIALARHGTNWVWPRDDHELEPLGSYVLGQMPAYLAFAERTMATAAEKVRRIHAGVEPYAADKAFGPPDGQVLGRCARAALDQNAAWLEPVLATLWKQASVAPGSAKTMPSQAASIAIGRAVEDMPNATAVAAMREVVAEVRHAGVKKKLARMLRTAERRLAARPDFIAQLPPDAKLTPTLVTAARRSIEMLFRSQAECTFDDWRERFLGRNEIRAMTVCLIWRIGQNGQEPFAAMPVCKRDALTWRCADGSTQLVDAGQSISLWHPLHADAAERDLWRDHIITAQVKQPFLQAFRQYYHVREDERSDPSTDMFAGHMVAMKSVMGVALSVGWAVDRNVGLSLRAGELVFCFDFGHGLYPGYVGNGVTGLVRVYEAGYRHRPAALGSIDPVVLSEVLRNVDLLTSAGALAYELGAAASRYKAGQGAGAWPVGQSAEMRREILRRLYATAPDVAITAHHVETAGHKIHIATARVTRNGEPVELSAAMAADGAIVWLPHDDDVLELIVRQVHAVSFATH